MVMMIFTIHPFYLLILFAFHLILRIRVCIQKEENECKGTYGKRFVLLVLDLMMI